MRFWIGSQRPDLLTEAVKERVAALKNLSFQELQAKDGHREPIKLGESPGTIYTGATSRNDDYLLVVVQGEIPWRFRISRFEMDGFRKYRDERVEEMSWEERCEYS